MEKIYSRIRNFKLPKRDEINEAIAYFSKKEWIVFIGLLAILLLSTLAILQSVNRYFMVSVPTYGGSFSEGIIGTPRFINPVLANSPADQDLVSLVYSGLMRKNSDGDIVPDLAEKYEVSKDGLNYTFTLKDKIYFQNEDPITVDDIIFTINEVKDTAINSPHRIEWAGVSVTKIDDKTIQFTLRQPYPLFLENATLGIMPASIWKDSPIELNAANTSPIGSGPYMIKNSAKESSGAINSFELTSFDKFALGKPYINTISLHFYSNEDDSIKGLEGGEVEQISSITPLNADILKERNYLIDSFILPRIFGLFFNQNQNQIFTDKVVVRAIDQAIDKEKIVQEVLFGYGVPIDGPIPPNLVPYQKLTTRENSPSRENIIKNVQSSLAKDGWIKGDDNFLQKTTTGKDKRKQTTSLAFSISTGNTPDLLRAAEIIKQELEEVGIKVNIKTFEVGNLNQGVIRPRSYDALLFGEIVNHESDLYAFWHSSQRNDPGLNVALYTNAKVDKLLEDAATTIDNVQRINKYAQFESEIKKDMPAVFLYSPKFIYVVSNKIKGVSIGRNTQPTDRFSNVYEWYTKTEDIWKIFTK
ncbi:MAG: ABC transporter substrate-binding protein [Candidatus Paceibacterota bacterium]|jgi:peptide/nickel transport system substrate-binding protein